MRPVEVRVLGIRGGPHPGRAVIARPDVRVIGEQKGSTVDPGVVGERCLPRQRSVQVRIGHTGHLHGIPAGRRDHEHVLPCGVRDQLRVRGEARLTHRSVDHDPLLAVVEVQQTQLGRVVDRPVVLVVGHSHERDRVTAPGPARRQVGDRVVREPPQVRPVGPDREDLVAVVSRSAVDGSCCEDDLPSVR